MAEIIDADRMNQERGRRLFEGGLPWPKYDHADRTAMAIWLGYHTARMQEFVRRNRTMKLLGIDA